MKKHILNKDGLTIIGDTNLIPKWNMRDVMFARMIRNDSILNYIDKGANNKKRIIKFIADEKPFLKNSVLSYYLNDSHQESINIFLNIDARLSKKDTQILKYYRKLFANFQVKNETRNIITITNMFNRYLYLNRAKVLSDLKDYLKMDSSFVWEELVNPVMIQKPKTVGIHNTFILLYSLNEHGYCPIENKKVIDLQIHDVLLKEKLYDIFPVIYYKNLDKETLDELKLHKIVYNTLENDEISLTVFRGVDEIKARGIYALLKNNN